MGADDTTEKLFPPPEGGHDRTHAPRDAQVIPLAPSIRQEFAAHHSAILGYLSTYEKMLDERLPRAPDTHQESPSSARQRATKAVTAGALVGLRYGGVAIASGELVAAAARALGRPEIAGPIEVLLQLVRGG